MFRSCWDVWKKGFVGETELRRDDIRCVVRSGVLRSNEALIKKSRRYLERREVLKDVIYVTKTRWWIWTRKEVNQSPGRVHTRHLAIGIKDFKIK